MPDPESRIDARLRRLEEAITALACRVARLERARGLPSAEDGPVGDDAGADHDAGKDEPLAAPGPAPSAPAALAIAPRAIDGSGVVQLAGRTCVVLGGAFLLRALTDTGRLPIAGGVALGFAYVLIWLAAAERAGPRRPASATFHGVAAVLIGLPLLWEAATRFALLGTTASAAALGVLTALAVAVAWHCALHVLAALALGGAAVVAAALAVATGTTLPFAALAVLISFAAWWLGDARRWTWLAWPAAAVAALLLAALSARALAHPPIDAPVAAMTTLLAFTALVFGVVSWRTLGTGAPLRPFDAAYSAAALTALIAAVVLIAPIVAPRAAAWAGAGAAVLGLGAYRIVIRRLAAHGETGNGTFLYFAAAGPALVMVGLSTALSGATAGGAFAALAAGIAWFGARSRHVVFSAHAAVFSVAAAAATGLLGTAARLWLAPPDRWPALPAMAWVALAAAIVALAAPWRATTGMLAIVAAISRVVLALVTVAGLATAAVAFAGPWFAGTPPDPGRLAALKTMLLSAAAVGLALACHHPAGRELGWLAYPVLVAGAVKLVAEDFRFCPPSLLFVTLATYGVALILTARMRRRPAVP